MITVAALRRMLQGIPDETVIVLQKDDEGNGYRYMNGIDFEPADTDDANMYNHDEGECIRNHEVEEYGSGEYILVAVAY